jgi:ATP-grasp ribosomal peptide maturase
VTVLVLAADLDPTVDAVIAELNRRDVLVFRADTAWFPQHMSLDARLEDTGAGRWSGTLHTQHRDVDLLGLRAAWYRGPTAFRLPDGLSAAERHHALWEAKLGVGGVLADLPVLWVNHPGAEADAAYKLMQLATAARCGLTVPATLVTNRPDAVRAFAATHGRLVVKPLSFGMITEDGATKPIYTHPLTDADLADLTGVETTAHLFQTYLADKAFEARVTAVGGRLFPAAIRAGSDQARIDWRSDYDSLHITPVQVPAPVAEGIGRFMTATRLVFGAFDFVVDRTGAWHFLECNSAGQYGFIEDATGQPINAALVDILEKGQA